MEKINRFRIVLGKEAITFLEQLNEKAKKKILKNMEVASKALNPELLKKLTGDIWEFRTLYAGTHYRMLAFWDKRDNTDTLVIATHGFVKKVSAVPKREIAKAEQIMEQYFNHINKN